MREICVSSCPTDYMSTLLDRACLTEANRAADRSSTHLEPLHPNSHDLKYLFSRVCPVWKSKYLRGRKVQTSFTAPIPEWRCPWTHHRCLQSDSGPSRPLVNFPLRYNEAHSQAWALTYWVTAPSSDTWPTSPSTVSNLQVPIYTTAGTKSNWNIFKTLETHCLSTNVFLLWH